MSSKKSRRERNQAKKARKRESREKLQKWQANRGIHDFSKGLNAKMYPSEKWFIAEFIKLNMSLQLSSNKVIDYYIPDFIYKKFIFEIDGSIHNLPEVIKKDKLKDKYLKKKGYTVVRVKAYCMTSFNEAIKKFKVYLGLASEVSKTPTKEKNAVKPKTILKKKKEVEKKKLHKLKTDRKNLCSICRREPQTTFIKYKGKTFYVCEKCKRDHEEVVKNKD